MIATDLKSHPFQRKIFGKTLWGAQMFAGRLIFKQVMDFIPLPTFRCCVAKYKGDFKVKTFSCLDQFLCMVFAQITQWESDDLCNSRVLAVL
jgi:hypothetical protein